MFSSSSSSSSSSLVFGNTCAYTTDYPTDGVGHDDVDSKDDPLFGKIDCYLASYVVMGKRAVSTRTINSVTALEAALSTSCPLATTVIMPIYWRAADLIGKANNDPNWYVLMFTDSAASVKPAPTYTTVGSIALATSGLSGS